MRNYEEEHTHGKHPRLIAPCYLCYEDWLGSEDVEYEYDDPPLRDVLIGLALIAIAIIGPIVLIALVGGD